MAKYLQIEHETTLRAIDAALEEFHIELPTGGAVHRDHGVHLLVEQLRRVEAEVDRLRAANAELVAMLDTAAQFIDWAAWSGQTFEDCETMTLQIKQAIARAKGEAK